MSNYKQLTQPLDLTPTPARTMLTNEDIEFIRLMIDDRINASKGARTKMASDYHTVHDIRSLIQAHIAEFRQFVREEPFSLESLRTFLRARTKLLPRDTEISPGDAVCDRFDRQVSNAIKAEYWPDCPIRKIEGCKNRYELVAA